MMIKYRKAMPNDIEEIYSIVHAAVDAMERDNIFQWDDKYPTQEDFQEDIDESQLYVGLVDGQIAAVYALNQKYDKEYENGKWKYKDEPFYIVHRLCVNPTFQNKGINPFALRLYNSLGYSEVGYTDWRKGRFCLMEKYF